MTFRAKAFTNPSSKTTANAPNAIASAVRRVRRLLRVRFRSERRRRRMLTPMPAPRRGAGIGVSMRLLRLSLRNLTRNKRRTLLTALAIAFGAFAVVLLEGFVNAFARNVIEASVLGKVGAMQVFRQGYIGSDDPLKLMLPQDPALVSRIRAVPGVTEVAPRLDFDGMISNGSQATMFVATAVDPIVEYRVCPRRASSVAPGSRPLGPAYDDSALIGKTLADALGAAPGSSLVMQAGGTHAGTNALDVAVSGFLPNYHPTESKRGATVTLAFAQRLLRAPGR